MPNARGYDVTVFGATGFTGKLTAHYLARRLREAPFRFAIAGRNREKLARLKEALDVVVPGVGVIQASLDDAASLERMARESRVVISAAGPYGCQGRSLIAACLHEGADYVDLTGEEGFVDELLVRDDAVARELGVRIVNCCGFGSVIPDLGVFFTVRQLPANESMTVEDFVLMKSAGLSGGSWQSAIEDMATLGRPKVTSPASIERAGRRVQSMNPRPRYERSLHAWAVPMPTIDRHVVLRSARALDCYGPDFCYGHYLRDNSILKLAAGAVGIGAVVALSQLGPARSLLRRLVRSGEGPSEEARARGRFDVTFRGRTPSRSVITRVSGGDPGYDESSKILAESALCLALDRDRLPACFGVLTPAVAMGSLLVERLEHAGIRFETLES
jgi:short subunit dehydrogenase-like uncharacterized protein